MKIFVAGLTGVIVRRLVALIVEGGYNVVGTVNTLVRRRHYPIAGGGAGATSFVHVDDAAKATVLVLSGPAGIVSSCDDRPAALKEWLPFRARLVGAPPPWHVPALAECVLGNGHLAHRSTLQRGASNAKAMAQLGFAPAWVTGRDGLRSEFERAAVA